MKLIFIDLFLLENEVLKEITTWPCQSNMLCTCGKYFLTFTENIAFCQAFAFQSKIFIHDIEDTCTWQKKYSVWTSQSPFSASRASRDIPWADMVWVRMCRFSLDTLSQIGHWNLHLFHFELNWVELTLSWTTGFGKVFSAEAPGHEKEPSSHLSIPTTEIFELFFATQ